MGQEDSTRTLARASGQLTSGSSPGRQTGPTSPFLELLIPARPEAKLHTAGTSGRKEKKDNTFDMVHIKESQILSADY